MPQLARRTAHSPRDWTDRQLLRRVLANQDVAWNELLRRYRALIFRCITKVTGKHAPGIGGADLDEIFADVLMNLVRDDMRKLRLYNPRRGTKLGSWLGMISINTTYDYLRAANRRPLLDKGDGLIDPGEADERGPVDILIEKERWAQLNRILAEFSDKDRTFVSLYYGQGLDPDAVATEMDISLKTVYSKKHKIRAHLRARVQGAPECSAIADLVAA